MFKLTIKMNRAFILLAFLTSVCVSAAFAQASSEVITSHEINIPAGTLASALDKLVDQAGVQIMYETRLTDGIRVTAVNGSFTFEAALARLLENTGLRADDVDARTVVLKRLNPATSNLP